MRLEDLGLVGNCQFSALIARSGAVTWCCLPRFDSEPIFSTLLDDKDGGEFLVGPADGGLGLQRYLPNTNVLETRFTGPDGTFRVVDFAPRFNQWDRFYRPTQLIRLVEPLEGVPRIRVRCTPRLGWSREVPEVVQGSNHVRWEGFPSPLRLTTDLPLTWLEGQPFTLTERRHLVLTWGAPVQEPLTGLCERMLAETVRYWQRWVKHCNVPALFQQEVIRSALALKLHCFEDTGAIVAAMTTSIPEAPGSGRTWDYRYCWLRDSYYVVSALRRLGHFEEREQFVTYLLNVASSTPDLELAPLYRVDGRSDLGEQMLPEWPGFHGEKPVRVGNAAARQRQNDVYGEMALALSRIFLDDRFESEQTPEVLSLLERLTRKAIGVVGTPDAGIWEVRTEPKPQTFSSIMSWAAADRMSRVAERRRPEHAAEFASAAARIRDEVLARGWSTELGSLVSTYDGHELDASLLEAATLRFLAPDDPRLASTVDTIWRELAREGWLFRYRTDDGFGKPTVAFIVCTFWLVEALAILGRGEESRAVFRQALRARSPLGLLAEDYETTTLRMWGNFPQAYSHVGLIHGAFACSPRWSEVL